MELLPKRECAYTCLDIFVLKYKLTRLDWLKDKLRLSLAYYFGEKYNTPSPFIKKKINTHFAKNALKWDEIAVDIADIQEGFHVLYAMQMQPEANIDVWVCSVGFTCI